MFLTNFAQGVFIEYEYDGHLRTRIKDVLNDYPHLQLAFNGQLVEVWYQSKLLVEMDKSNNKFIFQGGSTHTEKRIINLILAKLELQYKLENVMDTFYLINLGV